MRVHFVNENIGGHATMHRHVRDALATEADVVATFFDVPVSFTSRLAGAPWPVLGRFDLDLHALRVRLAQSAVVRRHLAGLDPVPDVIHFYTQNTALLSVERMKRTPAVVSIDAANVQNAYRLPQRRPTRYTPFSASLMSAVECRVFRAARRIVAHSSWAADAVRASGIPAGLVDVIPFGIAVPPLAPPRAERDGPPQIVFVGSSMARKGGWRLVELWQRHLSDRSRLLLVTTEHVRVDPRIEVRNDVRPNDGKLHAILEEADVFAFPGEIDAYGYALLEAMAAGLPVVAPGQAAVPEIVEHDVTGLVVPPGDDPAFAEALARLLEDRDARRELGAAGRRRVLERFDARKTTVALLELLREVAG
jgi:glycosyltransferase involved in cell wall biosynthesis